MSVGDLHRCRGPRLQQDHGGHVCALCRQRFAPVAIVPTVPRMKLSRNWSTWSNSAGFKTIMVGGNQERPIPSAGRRDRQKAAWYVDTIALDSPHNYEPFWQRCVAATQHSGSGRWHDRASMTNFTYNHVGHFAESNHAFYSLLGVEFISDLDIRISNLLSGF